MCKLCFQICSNLLRDNFGCHNSCRTPKKYNEMFKYYVLCANSVSKSVPIYYRDNFGCHNSCRTGYIEYASHPIALVQLDTFGNRYRNRGVPRNTMKYSNIMSYVHIVFPNPFHFTTGIILAATTVAGHPRNKMTYSNIMSYVQIVFPNLYQFTTGIILVATTVAGQGT